MRLFEKKSLLLEKRLLKFEIDRTFALPFEDLSVICVGVITERIEFDHGIVLGVVDRSSRDIL